MLLFYLLLLYVVMVDICVYMVFCYFLFIFLLYGGFVWNFCLEYLDGVIKDGFCVFFILDIVGLSCIFGRLKIWFYKIESEWVFKLESCLLL